MQNVSLPTVPIEQTFYLWWLTVSIFSIHNLYDNTGVFYVYDELESEEGKSSNEVYSFIIDY